MRHLSKLKALSRLNYFATRALENLSICEKRLRVSAGQFRRGHEIKRLRPKICNARRVRENRFRYVIATKRAR